MKHTANDHNLEVIHMGHCRDCGGTSLIAGVQAQNVDVQPSPWIAVSERMPTEADANNEGKVWAGWWEGEIWRCLQEKWDRVGARFYIHTHWSTTAAAPPSNPSTP